MATSSDRASLPPAGAPGHNGHRPGGKLVEFDEFIDAQLRTTRSHVRSVDLASELMVLAAGTLAFFLLAGVIDHWVFPGGLGFWGRLLLLTGLIAVVGYALAVRVLPLLLRRINPLYAAYTIERSSPTLKNSLVNFLMFRANPAALADNVYQAIEEQAATRLAGTQVEAAVDRTKLIRIGYVLVAIVVAAALYAIVSPKNLFKTVGRVVMPWAQIEAPTRTVISQIEPGDTQAFRGQQVTISAFIEGLPADARPRVLVSSADGQMVDAAVEMTLAPDEYRHACVLPAADASLQQSLTYRIEAGDAVTRPYMISVVAAPTIVVDSVEYKYPSYTGLLAQRVEHQGDIKAIEGTEITIHATANENIQSAYVDFDCDGKLDQPMQTDGAAASAKFTIELKPDRQTPVQSSYQLVFKNDAGQANPQPVRHRIEVTRDLPPEIQLVAPKKDEFDLPLNGAIDLEIVANDPDFALRSVKLSAARGDERLFEKSLLNEVWRGQLVRKFRLEPTKLGLKQGDQVTYFAVAEDNKEPQPNRSETAKRRIRIVSPVDRKANEDQLADKHERRIDDPPSGESKPGADGQQGHDEDPANAARDEQNKPGDPRSGDKPQGAKPENSPEPRDGQGDDRSDRQDQKDKSQDSQGTGQKSSEQKQGEQQQGAGDESQPGGEQQAAPNDGSNDRDAIERILERRDEQNKGQSDSQNSERQSKGDEQQSNSKGQGDRQGADQKADRDPSKSAAKDNSGQDRSSQGKQQGDRKSNEKPSPDKQSGSKQSGGEQSQRGQDSGDGRQGNEKTDQRDQREQGTEKGAQKEQGKSDRQQKSSPDKSTPQNKGQDGQAGKDKSASAEQAEGQSDKKATSGQRKPADVKQSNDAQPGKDAKSDDAKGPGEKSAKGKDKPSDKQPTDKQASDDSAKSTDDASGQGKPSKSSKTDAKPDDKRAQTGDKQDRSSDGDAKPADESGEQQDSKGKSDNKSGQGKQSKPDPTGKRDATQSREKKDSDEQASPGEKEKGDSGAGKPSEDKQGSPTPQGKNQPREKSPHESADESSQKPSDAKSPSTSDRESNSEGKEDGDRSGGGKKGGGQKANQQGTGGAGQNTPSDEGAGESNEAGKGDSSNRPGADRQSNEKTGQGGSQRPEGSQTKPTDGDGQPGQGTPQGGDAADAKQGDSAPGNQSGKSGSSAPDQPSGGRPGSSPTDRKWQPTEDAADEANLEYARKATDLAVTHLKDELKKDNPDPELLNRLHWTRDDLEKFVKRWEQMRAQAKAPGDMGAAARRELDDALRSLGLRPRATSMKGDAARGDKSQGYKESRRSSPPPEYAEQYKAYTQGTAKGGK